MTEDMTVKVQIKGESGAAIKAVEQFRQATDRARDALGRFTGAGKALGPALDGIGGSGRRAGEGMGAAGGAATGMTGSFIKAQVVLEALRRALDLTIGSFARFTVMGVQYNAAMEGAELGIASLVATQGKFVDGQGRELQGMEALNAARKVAAQQMQQLKVAGLETTATTQDLVNAFQQGLAPGLAAGMDVDQVRKFTVAMTQAAGALGLPMNQLGEEVRSLLGGNIDPRNTRIATALNITNAQIKDLKAQGPAQLFAFLEEKLQMFQVAGVETAKTWGGLTSNLQEAAETFAGMATQPLFEKVKEGLQNALSGVFDLKNARIADAFQGLLQAGQTIFSALGDLAKDALSWLVDSLRQASEWLSQNKGEVKEIVNAIKVLAQQVGGLLADILRIVVAADQIKAETGVTAKTFQVMAVAVAAVRDVFSLLTVQLRGLGAIFATGLLGPLGLALKAMAKIAEFLGKDGLAKDLNAMADATSSALGKAWKGIEDSAKNALGHTREALRELTEFKSAQRNLAGGLSNLDYGDRGGKKRFGGLSNLEGGIQDAPSLGTKPPPPDGTGTKDRVTEAEHKARLAQWAAESMERRTLSQEEAAALKKIEADLQKDLAKLQEEAASGKLAQGMYRDEVKARTAKATADEAKVRQDYAEKRLQMEERLNGQIEAADGDSLGRRLAAIQKTFAAIRQEARELGKDSELGASIDAAESRALVRAKADALAKDFSMLQAQLQADEQGITNLQDAGLITVLEARQRQADAIAARLPALQAALAGMWAQANAATAKAQSTGSADDQAIADNLVLQARQASNEVQVLTTNLQVCRNEWANVQQAGANALASGLVEALGQVASGTKSVSDAFRDMARDIIQSISQALAKMMLMQAAQSMFGKAAAGGSGWAQALIGAFGGSFAGGGYTGPGGKYEPAGIVHRGEYVFDQESTSYLGTAFLESLRTRRFSGYVGGGQVGPPSAGEFSAAFTHSIGLTLDPGLIANYISSPEGTRVIAKQVSANPKRFNRALGR